MNFAPIIAAGISTAGSIANNFIDKKRQAEERAYNESLWQKQNDYNSPLQQTERLLAAGLSPHLAYGSGSVSNTAGAIQPAGERDRKIIGLNADLLGAELAEAQARIRKTDAETDSIKANTSNAVYTGLTYQMNKMLADNTIDQTDFLNNLQLDEFGLKKGIFQETKNENKRVDNRFWHDFKLREDANKRQEGLHPFMLKQAETQERLTSTQVDALLQNIRHNEDLHPDKKAMLAAQLLAATNANDHWAAIKQNLIDQSNAETKILLDQSNNWLGSQFPLGKLLDSALDAVGGGFIGKFLGGAKKKR